MGKGLADRHGHIETVEPLGREIDGENEAVVDEGAFRGRQVVQIEILHFLCITDADEKQQQIPLMGEIYAQASKVRIWLGGDDSDGRAVVNALHRFRTWNHMTEVEIELLIKLLDHPWFQRRWTLQEAIAHDDTVLHLGNDRISFSWY